MSVVNLAQAIEDGRKALASAKALYDVEVGKVSDLKSKHAAELKAAADVVHAIESTVAAHTSKLAEMSSQMLAELGHNVNDDLKSVILAAQRNRK